MGGQPGRLNVRYYKANPSGPSIVRGEIEALGTDAAAALLELMNRKANHNLGADEDEHVQGKIWALRLSLGGQQYRLLYSPLGKGLIILALAAVRKKTRKLPLRTIKLAKKRRAQWVAEHPGA